MFIASSVLAKNKILPPLLHSKNPADSHLYIY